jgi:nitronate monooxygenase
MIFDVRALIEPIVLAPLAGGPSTPALAAAVSNAGGLGFLASGYRSAAATAGDIAALRGLTAAPFGVNIFEAPSQRVDEAALAAYSLEIAEEARRAGSAAGEPIWDDDDHAAKIDTVIAARVPVVSFTFGCPSRQVVARLRAARIAVWVTVTDPGEARQADAAGADALVAQGVEAGGHRGSFVDQDGEGEIGLLALLRLVRRASDLPMIAAGGIADGWAVAAVLAAGAAAAQLGSAFMRADEAGTSPVQREALAAPGPTALTRAFTGRRARGIVNRFMREHGATAPAAYPHVHHLTAPLRAAARRSGDPDLVNIWAGQAHELSEAAPAAAIMARLSREWREALARAADGPRHI